ncbi:MAG: O-antigen ligase family protein [bacterium]
MQHLTESKAPISLNTIPARWWIVLISIEVAIGLLVGIIPSVAQPELVIGIMVLIAYFGLALVRPQIALGILIFTYPFFNITLKTTYQDQTYNYMIIPVVLAPLIAIAMLARTTAKLYIPWKPQLFLLVPVFLLAVWSAFTTCWAQNQAGPWFIAIHFIVAVSIIYSTFQIIQTEKVYRQILWIVFYSGLITATAIILSTILTRNYIFNYHIIEFSGLDLTFQTFFYLMSEKSLRAMGFGTYNQMALVMTLQLFITGVLLLTAKKRKTQWLLGFAMLYMLYAQALTKTRAPMLGMLIGAVVAIYLLTRYMPKFKYKAVWLTTIVFILCLTLVILSIVGNFQKGLSRYTSTASGVEVKDSSWTLRLTWLENCTTYLVNSYGFGTGAGNITNILYEHAPHPHDTFLHLITELGFIGAIILFTIILSIIRKTIQALHQPHLSRDLQYMVIMITGGLVAFALSLAFEYDYFYDPTWYYLALLLVPINLALTCKDKEKLDLNVKCQNPNVK